MTPVEEVLALCEERLDMPYVNACARSVAAALHDGAAIEACYQPGDGTRYNLVFVPVQPDALRKAPARLAPMASQPDAGTVDWGDEAALGINRDPGNALVSWAGHSTVGLDLSRGGFVPVYLAELFNCGIDAAAALYVLLESIVEAFNG